MMLCLNCGFQRPNRYKTETCPQCKSYLKYIEAPAKHTAIKLHKAGISVGYATAEVYSYAHGAIHCVNINIGLAYPYQSTVLRRLPSGIGYVLPHAKDYLNHTRIELLLSPVITYGLLRYETPYFEYTEARAMLKKKLKELDEWVDEAVEDGWLAICNLAGLL